MKCPDCGTRLTQVSISSLDNSYRCFLCGGFFTEPSSVNRIKATDVARLSQITGDKSALKFGAGICPNDGSALTRFMGESVPMHVMVNRCGSCGYWWWPADNLLRFKPAQEAKVNYFKQWGIATDLSALTLPVLVLAVMVVGLGVGIYGVGVRQQATIGAGAEVVQYSATYLGEGVELVSFRSKNVVTNIEYRIKDAKDWRYVVVYNSGNDVYLARIVNLEEDQMYEVRISGKEFEFETN